MLDISLAPGCFGGHITYKVDSTECTACPFVEQCGLQVAQTVAMLSTEYGITVVKPRAPRLKKPVPVPAAETGPVAVATLPAKIAAIVDTVSRKGVNVAGAMSAGENPFSAEFLRVTADLVMSGSGVTRVEVATVLEQRLGWLRRSAQSAARQALGSFVALGAIQEVAGVYSLATATPIGAINDRAIADAGVVAEPEEGVRLVQLPERTGSADGAAVRVGHPGPADRGAGVGDRDDRAGPAPVVGLGGGGSDSGRSMPDQLAAAGGLSETPKVMLPAAVHSMLAVRTDFSIGDSTLSLRRTYDLPIPEGSAPGAKAPEGNTFMRDMQAVGATAVAITDTMAVTGLIEFTKEALKAGIKPVAGCRIRLVDDVAWRKPKRGKAGEAERARAAAIAAAEADDDTEEPEATGKRQPEYFVTAYARSEAGMRALYRIVSRGNDADHFYGNARIDFEELYAELRTVTGADLAITTSDSYGLMHHPRAADIVGRLNEALGTENVFLALTPLDTPLFDTLNKMAIEIGARTGNPFLVARPVAYQRDGADTADVHNAICSNTLVSSSRAKSPHQRDMHPLTTSELKAAVKAAAERLVTRRGMGRQVAHAWLQGLANTGRLVDSIAYEWKKQPISLPVMSPDEYGSVVAACKKGWGERFGRHIFGHRPSPEELKTTYIDRLKFELATLKKLGFCNYFLLTQEIVSFAKGAGIRVGPGRGSAAGSLVAYLMGITDCDPIRFGLLFERFINPERIDLPDADLDFMTSRRHEVFGYVIGKYGHSFVAGITNYGTLQSTSAINGAAKSLGMADFEYGAAKLVPKHAGVLLKLEDAAAAVPEIMTFKRRHQRVWSHATALWGTMRTLGQHAGGLIVSGCPIIERAAIERRKAPKAVKEGEAPLVETVVNWDKQVVEDQGFVKLDILGVQALDLLDLTCRYVRERHGIEIDLMGLPLDDQKVLGLFATGHTTGVFQFESPGMKRLARDLGGDGLITFDDLTAATALYRPGPLESGMTESFWKRKAGREPIEYYHELARPATQDTYGVAPYQEQIMRIARDVAGYTFPEADALRKAISKKLPAAMERERGKFTAGCIRIAGMTMDEASDLFGKIEKFASYSFNKSHSVAYTLTSYQSAYLKAYYPVEFLAAALSLFDGADMPGLLADATRLGIEVMLPDINASTARFEIVGDDRVLIPFTRVLKVGKTAALAILKAREAGPFLDKADLLKRVERKRCNVGHIGTLEKVGALASIIPGSLPARHEDRVRDQRDLIPGLINDLVPIHRKVNFDAHTKGKLEELVSRYQRDEAADGLPVKPTIGRNASFMIVSDAPSSGKDSEEGHGQMAYGRQFAAVSKALSAAGLSRSDGYWTALLKRPKGDKVVTPAEIERYGPYLRQEIDIIRPPVIVVLGSAALRSFVPDFKGKASEAAGKVVYLKALDANLVVGFSVGELYYDPSKQKNLDDVFARVAELIA